MAEVPLVSIIIPTHNSLRWLPEAVESALEQQYQRCETIVVDDGSTDGTGEWIQRTYGSRIRYLWQPHRGVAGARNAGLNLAQGEYLQLLDADDVILPEKVARQVAYLEAHPQWALVYSDTSLFYEEDRTRLMPWTRQHRYTSGNMLDVLVDSGVFLIHAALTRTAWVRRVGGFDEGLGSNEDWDLFLRMAAAGAQFGWYPAQPLALYRIRRDSRSGAHVAHGRSGVAVLQKLERMIPDPAERARLHLRQAIGRWRFAYGRALFDEGQRMAGWGEMVRGLLLDRRGMKYKLAYLLFGSWRGLWRTG